MADEPFLDESLDRAPSRNVLGGQLEPCSREPLTGFFRTGCCDTSPQDQGVHTVCALMTQEFLDFSVAMGNDLVTPMPAFGFPGLVPGNRWCLCALRWKEALAAGVAPPVVLASTHERTLEHLELGDLVEHAIDVS
jgi:uncharacterized protein (DUF2237 family)